MSDEMTATTLDELTPGMAVSGTVRLLGLYGAMIDIGLNSMALLHRSQFGDKAFQELDEVTKVGQTIDAYILKVDQENARIALTMTKPPSLPWEALKKGETYRGTVTRIEQYGVFIDIGAERPGMVHISEMADGYVERPEDVVQIGDAVDVRVIKLSRRNRQIDLSMKTPVEEISAAMEPEEDLPTAMEIALRRAQQQASRNEGRGNRRSGDRRGSRRYQDDIIRRTLANHESDE